MLLFYCIGSLFDGREVSRLEERRHDDLVQLVLAPLPGAPEYRYLKRETGFGVLVGSEYGSLGSLTLCRLATNDTDLAFTFLLGGINPSSLKGSIRRVSRVMQHGAAECSVSR